MEDYKCNKCQKVFRSLVYDWDKETAPCPYCIGLGLRITENINLIRKGNKTMFRTQKTYGALWDYSEEIRTGQLSIKAATKLCLVKRNTEAKALRKQGLKVVCGSLPNQLRPYWSCRRN